VQRSGAASAGSWYGVNKKTTLEAGIGARRKPPTRSSPSQPTWRSTFAILGVLGSAPPLRTPEQAAQTVPAQEE
jgi:hypothetical protein